MERKLNLNKPAFMVSLSILIQLIFIYLPIGIYFGDPAQPWSGFYSQLQMYLHVYQINGSRVYLWGILSENHLGFWYNLHLLTFVLLFLLPCAAAVLAAIGSFKESSGGKKMLKVAMVLQLMAFLHAILGIPYFSPDILGANVGFLEIYANIYFGFYLMVLNTTMLIVSSFTHSTEGGEA